MKYIFIFLCICCSINTSYGQLYEESKTSKFFNFENNENYTIGLSYNHFGLNHSKVQDDGIGMYFSIYGVYGDLNFGLSQDHSRDVRIDRWKNDKRSFSFHIGYQLPITKCIKIGPVIGYTSTKIGRTDGSYYTVNQYGIHNSFHSYGTDFENIGFDYGVNMNITIPKHFNINITYTKQNISIGIGGNIPFGCY